MRQIPCNGIPNFSKRHLPLPIFKNPLPHACQSWNSRGRSRIFLTLKHSKRMLESIWWAKDALWSAKIAFCVWVSEISRPKRWANWKKSDRRQSCRNRLASLDNKLWVSMDRSCQNLGMAAKSGGFLPTVPHLSSLVLSLSKRISSGRKTTWCELMSTKTSLHPRTVLKRTGF